MTRVLSRPLATSLFFVGAATLFLLPLTLHPGSFAFSPGAEYSDALLAHLSNALFLRRAVETWGQIPLWNPTILSGVPFAADPLSGLWYPPMWILALVPTAATIQLLFLAHLALGGWGMFLLLRSEGLGPLAALTGGLAFAGMPKLIGHIGLGHLSLVSAVCWSPWILHAAGRAIRAVGQPRSARAFLLPGSLLGLVFLADPRWTIPLGLLALGYAVWCWIVTPNAAGRTLREGVRGAMAAGVAIIAVAATFALPLAELVGQTTRASLSVASADIYAFPAPRMLGLLISSPGAWAEWLVSMGSVAFVLAIAGLAGWPKRTLFWALVLIFSLLLSLGRATPIGQLFAVLPMADLIRVPARWLFASGLAIAALAAYGLSLLESEIGTGVAHRARLAALSVAVLVLGVSLGLRLLGEATSAASPLFALLAASGVIIGLSGRRPGWIPLCLVALLVLELVAIDVTLIEARSEAGALASGRSIAARLSEEDGGRVFSPSYAVPQEAAAESGLELADGVHPLQLAGYVDFMAGATGFAPGGYSVTLPPFPSGDPANDWGPRLDAEALGLISVARVASSFPIEADGLSPEGTADGVLLYRNAARRPWAWVETDPAGGSTWAEVAAIDRSPNRIDVRASGPGRLVLSELMYPGWTATVDGEEVTVEAYRGLLRSVQLQDGAHDVRFAFVPGSLVLGIAVALAAGLGVVSLWRRE